MGALWQTIFELLLGLLILLSWKIPEPFLVLAAAIVGLLICRGYALK
jgi:hydrogenase/urease accessory protein HupE